MTQSSVVLRCGEQYSCGPSGAIDYGYATAALVLDNEFTNPPQTLFYQARLRLLMHAPL